MAENLPESPKQGRPNRPHGRFIRKERILRSTAALPALFTIGNGLAGFASIYLATKDWMGDTALFNWNLQVAAWLIFAAMVFDMLDGRVARMTRRTSDFGAQLDSLCDVISFGVAPAMLMVKTVIFALHNESDRLGFILQSVAVDRAILCVAGVFVACAALRLARFNVENEPDESAHMSFRGLPSPGAAAAVAAMVLLFANSAMDRHQWSHLAYIAVSITLPFITLACALLMVSRFRYPHIVNQYLRTKRPLGYIVRLVIIGLALMTAFYASCAVIAVAYALSGPLHGALQKLRERRQQPAA